MAKNRVKGITIQLGGDTTGLDKALQGTNKNISSTQSQLKDVERLLKLDPKNTVLLEQKQRLLAEAISETESKLDALNEANDQVSKSVENYDVWKAAYDPIQKEIDTTSKKLKDLRNQQSEMKDCGEVDTDAYKQLTEEIQNSSKELRDLKKQAQEVSNEFGNPISPEQYDALQREIAETQGQLNGLKDQMKGFGSVAAQQAAYISEQFEKIGGKIADTGEKIKDAGEKSMKVTSAIVAAGTAAVVAADGLDSAANTFLTATGTFAKAMIPAEDGTWQLQDNAEKVKEVIEEIYSHNYGDGFEDIAQAMATIANTEYDFDLPSLEKTTESALALRDTFDMDINESVRAVNSLMDQFGVTADDAFSLIVQGAQAGLNQNGDLLDVINEYSVQFKGAGVSAEEMFNMLSNGVSAGTWSVDKLGDAVKEFNIRMTDGSAKDAVEALGFSWEKVSADWIKGGDSAKGVFNMLITELSGLERETDFFNAGVGLLGTMYEDLGQDAVHALSDMQGEISVTSDAMAALKEQKYDDLKNEVSQLGRAFISDVAMPIGELLIPVITEIIDSVSAWIEAFGELPPVGQRVIVIIAAIIAAIGPALMIIGHTVTAVGNITSSLGKVIKILPKLQTTFSNVFGFIASNPIVMLIAAVALFGDQIQEILGVTNEFLQGLFVQDWTEVFGPVLGGILNGFFQQLEAIWNAVYQIFNGVIDFIRGVFTLDWERAWRGVVQIFEGIFDGLAAILKAPINGVIQLINSAIDGINWLIDGVNKIPGVNLSTIGRIPMLADGGEVLRGSAIVGEDGAELLTVMQDRTVVQPLTQTTTHRTTQMGGVNVHVYGAPGQDVRELAELVLEEMQGICDSEEAALT